jgi:hypothetical protein
MIAYAQNRKPLPMSARLVFARENKNVLEF